MAKDVYDVLDLKALRCFWAMARNGSLTQAGIELGISEAAVSQRIKSLEAYIGTKLYEAKGGHVRLTEAGERAQQLAVALFDQVEAFQGEVLAEEEAGTITLAAAEPILYYVLPDIVGQFSRKFPRAQFRLLSQHSWHSVDALARNETDVAIIPERDLPDSLLFQPWRTFRGYLILPVGHELLQGGQPAIADLLNESTIRRFPLISTEEDDPEDQRVQATLRSKGLPYNVRLHVGNLQTVKRYVARGLGIAVVSELCLEESDTDSIVAIPIPPEFNADTTYGIALRKDKYRTVLITELLKMLGAQSPAGT